MRINGAAGFARQHRADHVANGNDFGALVAGLALRRQRVRRFTGLADGDDQAAFVHNRVAVAEFAAVVHFDRHVRQPLDHEFAGQPRVPARAAGDDLHIAESAELFVGDFYRVEKYFAGFLRNPSEQGVADRTRLLENFLLHEMLEAALFGHDRVPGDVLGGTADGPALEIKKLHSLRRDHGDLAVAQKENAARVRENRRNVAGHEKLFVAQADHDRRSQPRGHNLVRIFGRKRHERVRAGHRFHGPENGFLQRCVLREFLNQVRDDLGVRFGNESVPFGNQLFFQLDVVLDDAVVHHHDFTAAIAMRMCIFFGGSSVRRPAGVPDTIDALQGSDADGFFKVSQFPRRAANIEFAVLAHNGNSRRVVAAVFQPPEAVQNQRNDAFGTYIAYDSTHGCVSPGLPGGGVRGRQFNYASTNFARDAAGGAAVFLREGSAGKSRDQNDRRGNFGRGTLRRESVEHFEAEFFDDRIGENLLGDAFYLRLRFGAVEAIQFQHEKLSLPHAFHLGVAKRCERALNRLPLRIEDGGLQHDPDVCFHFPSRESRAIIAGPPILRPRENPRATGASRWAAETPH